MSNKIQSLFLVVAGILVGGVAIQAVESDESVSEQATPMVAVSPATAEPTAVEEAPPEPPALAFDIEVDSAMAFGHDGITYARVTVTPGRGVSARDVSLDIDTGGAKVRDVYGGEWKRRDGGARIELDKPKGAIQQIVLELESRRERVIETRVSYQDLGGDRPRHTTQRAVENAVNGAFHSPEIEALVQQEYASRSIEKARQLMEERKFDEALSTVDDARGWVADTGLALRISGDLDRAADDLRELRSEIVEAKKPRPVRRKPPKPTIEIIRADRAG